MESAFHLYDRRKYPRVPINLPLEYRESNNSLPEGGLVSNLSELGMLVHSIKDISIGSEFETVIFFSNGFEFDGFRAKAKAVWKDLHFETDWKGYKCGLRFVQILQEDRWKLLNLLRSPLLSGGGL